MNIAKHSYSEVTAIQIAFLEQKAIIHIVLAFLEQKTVICTL